MPAKSIAVFFVILLISAFAFAEDSKDEASTSKLEEISVEIRHCSTCGFRSRAAKLAEELKIALGIEASLVTGDLGSFDVFVNGELLFSKQETGRFPNPEEIVEMIEEYVKE